MVEGSEKSLGTVYIRDVGAVMSKYGYFGESDDASLIDKLFGVAFADMAGWPSDKSD